MYDQTAVYQCSSDHYPKTHYNEVSLQCHHGVYPALDNQLVCAEKCGPPPSLHHAAISNHNDSTVNYICDEDSFDHDVEEGEMRCENGSWVEIIEIDCRKSCDPDKIPSGVQATYETSLTDRGEVIATYTCLDGYHAAQGFTDPHELSCVDDMWASSIGPHQPLNCTLDCPGLATPTGAVLTHNDSNQIRFTCDTGYSLTNGNLALQCVDGLWIGQPPTCSKICPSPPVGDQSTHELTGANHSTVVIYSCNKGSHPISTHTDPYTVTCTDGLYNSSNGLLCEMNCVAPPSIAGLSWTVVDVYSARGECAGIYTLIGQDSIDCEAGAWTGDLPYCVKHCSEERIPKIINGWWNVTGDLYNQTISYTCENG